MEDPNTEAEATAEFPKMLYRDGQAYGETGRGVPHQDTRVVNDAAEEQEARDEGFSDFVAPERADEPEAQEGGEETTAGSEPPAGSATDSDPAHVLQVDGAPGADSVEGAAGADTVAGAAGTDSVSGSDGASA